MRRKLAFRSFYVYYVIMVLNGFFRFSWLFIISPQIADNLFSLKPNVFRSLLDGIELVRRCIWNFIRLEYEHIKHFKSFNALDEVFLPISE